MAAGWPDHAEATWNDPMWVELMTFFHQLLKIDFDEPFFGVMPGIAAEYCHCQSNSSHLREPEPKNCFSFIYIC